MAIPQQANAVLRAIDTNTAQQQSTNLQIQGLADTFKSIGQQEEDTQSSLGSLKAEGTQLKGNVLMDLQDTITGMSTELGTNRDADNYALAQRAKELNDAHDLRVARESYLHDMENTSFLDNPLQALINMVTIKSQRAATKEAADQEQAAAASYNDLVSNTTAAANMAKATARTTNQAIISNEMEQQLAASSLEVQKIKAENLTKNVTLLQAVQQGNNALVENSVKRFGVMAQERQLEMSEENQKRAAEEFEFRKQEHQDAMEFRRRQLAAADEANAAQEAGWNYVVKGMVAMGKQPPDGLNLKTAKALWNTPEGKKAFGVYFDTALNADVTGGTATTYGAPLGDSAQASLNIATYGGRGLTGPAVPLLRAKFEDLRSGRLAISLQEQELAKKPEGQKQLLGTAITTAANNFMADPDANTSELNPYGVTLAKVINTPVIETKFGQVVLKPAAVAGRSDLNVTQMMQQATEAVKAGQMTVQEASAGLAQAVATGMATNNAGINGILPAQNKYPVRIQDASWFIGTSVIDTSDPAKVAQFMLKSINQDIVKGNALTLPLK